jgi:hypothetical protein
MSFMSENDASSRDDGKGKDVDPWVQSQLSAYHIVWLEKQRSAVDPSEILKCALAEWVARHRDDWFGHTNVGTAMRSALDEFIRRHREEFISME